MVYKDINECLLAGVPAAAVRGCLEAAQDFAPSKVKPSQAFRDALMSEWFDHEDEPGLILPFEFPWRVRDGELTVWTGIEKSGKTTLLQFVLMCLFAQGERGMVCSLEVKASKSLKKISRQVWGGLIRDLRLEKKLPDDRRAAYRDECRPKVDEVLNWLRNKLWIYDHTGIAHWRQVLDDIRWARRRHGIKQFVLDNLMRLGIVKDDYAQQADAVTAMAQLAMDLDVHIHLVAHQNKEGGGKRSVAGAHEIIAAAHNIVGVERDEAKGEKMHELFQRQDAGLVKPHQFNEEKAALDAKPDGRFVLYAQRDGDHQNASKYLWFLWESQQYCDVPPGRQEHAAMQFCSQPEPAPELPEEDLPE
jgi:twinkle protein